MLILKWSKIQILLFRYQSQNKRLTGYFHSIFWNLIANLYTLKWDLQKHTILPSLLYLFLSYFTNLKNGTWLWSWAQLRMQIELESLFYSKGNLLKIEHVHSLNIFFKYMLSLRDPNVRTNAATFMTGWAPESRRYLTSIPLVLYLLGLPEAFSTNDKVRKP